MRKITSFFHLYFDNSKDWNNNNYAFTKVMYKGVIAQWLSRQLATGEVPG